MYTLMYLQMTQPLEHLVTNNTDIPALMYVSMFLQVTLGKK